MTFLRHPILSYESSSLFVEEQILMASVSTERTKRVMMNLAPL